MVGLSPVLSRRMAQKLFDLAKREQISVQTEIDGRSYRYHGRLDFDHPAGRTVLLTFDSAAQYAHAGRSV